MRVTSGVDGKSVGTVRRRLGRLGNGLWLAAALMTSVSAHAQVIYTYEDVPAAPITTNNNNCPSGGTSIVRTINVPDSFNVGGVGTVALGVMINHTNRDHVQIRLQAPNGNTVVLADGSSTGTFNNYNATFGDTHDTSAPVDDGDNDPSSVASGTVFYRRLINVANLTSTLYPAPGSVNGNWTLRICDDTVGTAGTYVRSRLTLRDDSTTSLTSQCGSSSTFDWGAVTTVPATAIGDVLADGTTLTAGGVVFTQTQSVSAPADSQPSFRRLATTNGNDPGYYALIMSLSTVAGTDDGELAVESVRFTMDPPIAGLDLTLLDSDFGGATSWEDLTQVIGFNEAG